MGFGVDLVIHEVLRGITIGLRVEIPVPHDNIARESQHESSAPALLGSHGLQDLARAA